MTHEEKIPHWLPPRTGLLGVEIGAGVSPVPGLDLAPTCVDCFKSFAVEPNRADYYGHAAALPFHDHSLDFVIASPVLEHVANPVAALDECYRVVQPGGFLYLVVPDRRATSEHGRTLTSVEYLLEDYHRVRRHPHRRVRFRSRLVALRAADAIRRGARPPGCTRPRVARSRRPRGGYQHPLPHLRALHCP